MSSLFLYILIKSLSLSCLYNIIYTSFPLCLITSVGSIFPLQLFIFISSYLILLYTDISKWDIIFWHNNSLFVITFLNVHSYRGITGPPGPPGAPPATSLGFNVFWFPPTLVFVKNIVVSSPWITTGASQFNCWLTILLLIIVLENSVGLIVVFAGIAPPTIFFNCLINSWIKSLIKSLLQNVCLSISFLTNLLSLLISTVFLAWSVSVPIRRLLPYLVIKNISNELYFDSISENLLCFFIFKFLSLNLELLL